MKKNQKEDLREELKKTDKSLLKHCATNSSAFIKLYNVLCRKCKHKIKQKPNMSFEEYCVVCKKRAEVILK